MAELWKAKSRSTSNIPSPVFRAILHKGTDTRVYTIDEAIPGWWQCVTSSGVQVHCTRLVEGRRRAQLVAEQFQCQVDRLIGVGWMLK